MKHLRYYAEFYDRKDRKYRVELYQESETAYDAVEVELAADPVTIEWQEVGKLDPVRGSGATLRLISMTDRQFYDMYSVDYGVIELNVLREENGAFKPFWLGTLDPELFSEPYAYADRYVTELTFVDFAVLDYAMWDGVGQMTVEDVVAKCVQSARITTAAMPRVSHISTTAVDSAGATITPLDCVISAENFYDEDGEAMTMREVLEETLRPFALQAVQRNAQLYIYDLNALASLPAEQMDWYSDDSSLEADVVYNNIKVRFSPYQRDTMIDASIDYDSVLRNGDVTKVLCKGYTEGVYDIEGDWSVPIDTEGFNLLYGVSNQISGDVEIINGARFFKIEPIYSGDREAGILWGYSNRPPTMGTSLSPNSSFCCMGENYDKEWPQNSCTPIVKFPKFYVGKSDGLSELRFSLELLYDAKKNYFEGADYYKIEKGSPSVNQDFTENDNYLKDVGVKAFIPVVITIQNKDGEPLYRYANNVVRYGGSAKEGVNYLWVPVAKDENVYQYPSWFSYYDDAFGGKGVLDGWVKNHRTISRQVAKLPGTYSGKNNGEYIPMPPEGGFLSIEICSGILFESKDKKPVKYDDQIYTTIPRIFAYGQLEVKIVPKYGSDSISGIDIEDSAWVNKLAREELSIDTIIGSPSVSLHAAVGLIRSGEGEVLTEFSRAGYTDRIERLLIGTAYSQYASRKNVLSGTIDAPIDFTVLSDATIDGKYMVVSEVMNVEEATSEIRAVEFSADSYSSIEDIND